MVKVKITTTSLAPVHSVAYAPLRLGFHNGTFDCFNAGQTPSAAIISIAEGGTGTDWFPAFQAAQASASVGSVDTPPLLSGGSVSRVFTVDTAINQYFTFAVMVVPSNDYFLGNDSPTQYQLFDAAGNLLISSITQKGSDIWDAGSEVDGAFGAEFLVGSWNSDRIPDSGVVAHDFADLSIFNGLTTAVQYTFSSQLTADTDVYRISFALIRPGDTDQDGDVDLSDLGVVLAAFGKCSGDAGYSATADIDANGCVELSDLGIVLANYGL